MTIVILEPRDLKRQRLLKRRVDGRRKLGDPRFIKVERGVVECPEPVVQVLNIKVRKPRIEVKLRNERKIERRKIEMRNPLIKFRKVRPRLIRIELSKVGGILIRIRKRKLKGDINERKT